MKPYYQDELVTLYHGHCLEVTEWVAADVLVTDPPYGVSWMSGALSDNKKLRDGARDRKREFGADIAGDHNTEVRDGVLTLWGKKPAIVFGTWRSIRPENVSNRLIWHKLGRFSGVNPNAWYPNDEEIYLIGKGWQGKPTATVITTHESRGNHAKQIGHPTPKPVGLMEILINKAPPGVIADPFAGSGSTLLAAKNAGRRAIGVELKLEYCRIAANRLSQGVML